MDAFLGYITKHYTPKEIIDQCFKYKNLCKKHRRTVCKLLIEKHGYKADDSFNTCQVFYYLQKVFNVMYIKRIPPKDPVNVKRILHIAERADEPFKTEINKFIALNDLTLKK
jgi:hypothetical protein